MKPRCILFVSKVQKGVFYPKLARKNCINRFNLRLKHSPFYTFSSHIIKTKKKTYLRLDCNV